MRKFLLSTGMILAYMASALARTSFEIIDEMYKKGSLKYEETVYYKIIALKAPNLLPNELRGTTPLKCGTGFAVWLKRHENELPFELKPAIRWAFMRPVLPLTYDTPGGHFKIHYTLSGVDRVPDTATVRRIGGYLERVWAFEIDTLGFPAPPSDRGAGGDNRYDVYIRRIDAYGITWQEDEGPAPWNDYTSYIEINNDFSSFPPNTDPDGHNAGAQKVTCAHEFFHAIQMGIDAHEEGWWMEMSSVWMEETAYDTVNDYYNYLPDFFGAPEVSLLRYDGSHEYGAGIFPIYLSTKWGNWIMRSIWNNCKWNNAINAISMTLDSLGTSFEEALMEFFVWNYFTSVRNDGRHYPEGSSYPGVRLESVHSTYPASGSTLRRPNGMGCNYIMFRPGSSRGTVQISPNCQTGLRWGVAIVRVPFDGESSFSTVFLPSGGTAALLVSPVERFNTFALIVSPVGGNVNGNYNFTYVATLTGELYPPPVNLFAGSGYNRMVPLRWQAQPGYSPSRYIVYRKPSGTSSFNPIASVVETSYNDHDVINGLTYIYAVTAIYDSVESAFSDTVIAIPGGGVVVDSLWIIRDNNDPAAYISDLSPGEIVGMRIVTDDFSYSYYILKVSFLLYNFNSSVVGESLKVKVFSVEPGYTVGELLYESPPFWATAFYPSGWCTYDISSARIQIPAQYGVIVGIEFLSGTTGTIPSILTDSQNNIQRNINFYFSDGRWLEHYSFWRNPNFVGYNMIRALVERRTTGIENIRHDRAQTFILYKAYPNPFNSTLNIKLENIPSSEKLIAVSAFDTQGRKVAEIFNGEAFGERFELKWNAKTQSGESIPTGMYLIEIKTNNYSLVEKVLYIR